MKAIGMLLLSVFLQARAMDELDPEFLHGLPPQPTNLVTRAEAHAGESSGGADKGGWELLFPKTTAAVGGILGALSIWWTYNNVDLADSNGGPDEDAAAALQAEKERQAQAQAGDGGIKPAGEYAVLINGTFTGSPEALTTGAVFTPSITLSSATAGAGDITGGNRSDPAYPQVSGKWTGGYGAEIVLRTTDPAYTGIATVGAGAITINGRRLFAQPGAEILFRRQAEVAP